MTIPWTALFGGLLIGFASLFLYLISGRIAGISGMIKSNIVNPAKQNLWGLWFMLGLILGAILYNHWQPIEPLLRSNYSTPLIMISGFLVGLGTFIGNGCTSGHGVCGMGRLSKRSLVATITFIGMGIVTVTLLGLAQ